MKPATILAFFLAAAAVPAPAADSAPPNIILIISDDHGFPDYGFMGSETARTPNLDRMAAASLLYTRGYVMPVCSPSLACLLTGELPHVHGITGNDLGKAAIGAERAKGRLDRSPLSGRLLENPMILPRALGEAGYLTFQTGKLWNVTAGEAGFTAGMTDRTGRHGGDGLSIGRESMQPIYEFMDDARKRGRPFFVWYAPLMPHLPHDPPKAYLEHFESGGLGGQAAKYHAMVEWFDHTCGELDDYLERNDLAGNTVIIYLADNGWDAEQGDRAKLSPYELGIRTPIFVRWPGKVKPARDERTPASIIDIAPTVLRLGGVKDAVDLPGLDLLDREAMAARNSVLVEAYTHNIAALGEPAESLVTRVIVDGWSKLLVPGPVRPDQAYTSAPTEVGLFELESDPFEKRNLAKERPEEVARLRELLDAAWTPSE